ncbi:MAG TPA: methenyltetrahydromethanopterin cyclohydrolase, partial [Variovorax sp.]|nr:methenyltetrahydromethanopterin cyclohydrolase [Variovorax sp.]
MTDSTPAAAAPFSVNTLARPLVERLLREADALGVLVRRDEAGVCIVDAGIDAAGSVDAGLL